MSGRGPPLPRDSRRWGAAMLHSWRCIDLMLHCRLAGSTSENMVLGLLGSYAGHPKQTEVRLCRSLQASAFVQDVPIQGAFGRSWLARHSVTGIKTKSATPNSCSNVLLRWNNRHHQAAAYWRFDGICAFVAWCSRDWGPSNAARWSARGKHATFKERLPPPLATPACTACYWDLLGELQGRK